MINVNGKMVFTDEEKNELAAEHYKLIYKVATKFASTSLDYEELYGEAQVGFVNALNTYNPNKNTKFTTYAFVCMEKQLLSYLRGETKRAKLKVTSLDEMQTVKNNGNAISQSDVLFYKEMVYEGKDLNCIESGYQKTELEEYLKKEFGKMDEVYAKILIYRFGLFSSPEYTQAEIAEFLNTSQSNISKMEKKALEQFGKSTFLEYCGIIDNAI